VGDAVVEPAWVMAWDDDGGKGPGKVLQAPLPGARSVSDVSKVTLVGSASSSTLGADFSSIWPDEHGGFCVHTWNQGADLLSAVGAPLKK